MPDQTKYTNKLKDSRILVIGGTSGIGYAVAEACLEHGAIVHISSSNPDKMKSKIESLLEAYPSAKDRLRGSTVDLNSSTLESNIGQHFEDVVKDMPNNKLDHVIFTAADPLAMGKLEDLSMDGILQAGKIRFFAPLLIARYLPKYVDTEKAPGPSYSITTGGISEHPIPNWSVIASYAGGHHSMVRNLALDLRGKVRVCGVSPGVVDTELWKMEGKERQEFLDMCASRMCTGVPGLAEEVAESYLAVLKDRNMTGSVVRTDGGHTS